MESTVEHFEKNGEPWKRTILPGGGIIEEIDIPIPATTIRSYGELWARMTHAEQLGLIGAEGSDPVSKLFCDNARRGGFVDLTSVDLSADFAHFVTAGLLDAVRAAEVLV
ncbi:MAG: hypothetical protein WC450_08890 [Candidatus Omnitrophota bacterium]|jgi:hypothetical protein